MRHRQMFCNHSLNLGESERMVSPHCSCSSSHLPTSTFILMGGFNIWGGWVRVGVGSLWQTLPHGPHDICMSKKMELKPLE